MVSLNRIFQYILVVALFVACSKDETPGKKQSATETDSYRIDLWSPSSDTTILISDSIQLSANIVSPWGLHEYVVSVTDQNGLECFYDENHSHEWEFLYSKNLKIDPSWISPLTLKIITNNHDAEIRKAEVKIKILY